jgi:acyl transferase domain-containing protein
VCQIANDNGGGQLVISGAKAAVELAARLCTEKGAKRALMLSVSAPFHSALMGPAAEAMREALASVKKNAPAVPVVSNVSATPLSDPDQIVARLVEQVTGRVRDGGMVRRQWRDDALRSGGRESALRTGAAYQQGDRDIRHQHTGRCRRGDGGVGVND